MTTAARMPTNDADPRVERQVASPVGLDEVRHREARDAEHGGLGQRDHPAVAREEREAHGGDPEPQGLGQDLAEEVLAEEEGPSARMSDRHHADRKADPDPCDGAADHAGRPNSPRGRTASTKMSRRT